jgi:hypothetical protein
MLRPRPRLPPAIETPIICLHSEMVSLVKIYNMRLSITLLVLKIKNRYIQMSAARRTWSNSWSLGVRSSGRRTEASARVIGEGSDRLAVANGRTLAPAKRAGRQQGCRDEGRSIRGRKGSIQANEFAEHPREGRRILPAGGTGGHARCALPILAPGRATARPSGGRRGVRSPPSQAERPA